MTSSNANALAIENRGEIMRMNILEREAHNTTPLRRRRTVNPDSLDFLEL
jgi:hypothetical protein